MRASVTHSKGTGELARQSCSARYGSFEFDGRRVGTGTTCMFLITNGHRTDQARNPRKLAGLEDGTSRLGVVEIAQIRNRFPRSFAILVHKTASIRGIIRQGSMKPKWRLPCSKGTKAVRAAISGATTIADCARNHDGED